MKVLVISPTSNGIGGVAQHVSKLAEKLRERGFLVEVLSCGRLRCVRRKGLSNPSFTLLSAAASLARRGGYDVVHAHNIPSAPAMRLAGGWKVLTLHGVFSDQISFLYGRPLGELARGVERAALRWADALTAVSRDVARAYGRMGYRVHYVPNAIDLKDLPSDATRLYDRQVIYAGRLSREKGVLDLTFTFFRHNVDAHLVLVGDGPLRPALERLAARSGNIHVLGYKPRSEALKLVKGSDAFVLPSYHEGLSTALLEAMALGVPCVATAVGGNVELLGGGAGVLVKPGDIQGLAEAVRLVLSDGGLARELARKAYERVLARYTWDIAIQRYLKVYTAGL